MQEEEWRWIKGFENRYLISNRGRVMSMPTVGHSGGLLVQHVSNSGYLQVSLRDNSLKSHVRTVYTHRVVAETFLDNPKNEREIDHIDCNKLNNSVENLEWVSSQENKIRAHANDLYPHERRPDSHCNTPVIMDGTVKFNSIKEAAAAIGVSRSSISRAINSTGRKVCGHVFTRANIDKAISMYEKLSK